MAIESSSGNVEVSVFPLAKVTLFPNTTKPLNIFEPRYIAMVQDALENDEFIALAYHDPASAKAKSHGVLGHVRSIAGVGRVQLIEKRQDGTMLILLHAVGKVELLSSIPTDLPYIKAKARWIQEDKALSDSYLFVLSRLMKDLNRWLMMHIPDPHDRKSFLEQLQTPEDKINAVCSLMVLDADAQQTLLEVDSLGERCSQLALAIESESPAQ